MIRSVWNNLWPPLVFFAVLCLCAAFCMAECVCKEKDWHYCPCPGPDDRCGKGQCLALCRAEPPKVMILEVSHYMGFYVLEGPGVEYKGSLSVTVTREQAKDTYSAAVVGTYLGRSYFLPVSFAGTPDRLKGAKVTLGKETFSWQGKIKDGNFTGMILSKDYTGSFELKEKKQ